MYNSEKMELHHADVGEGHCPRGTSARPASWPSARAPLSPTPTGRARSAAATSSTSRCPPDRPGATPSGVTGGSTATSKGGASVDNGNTSGKGIQGSTSGKSGVLGGNQVNAPVSAPINACGNAISLFGNSDAGCKGGSEVKTSGQGGAGKNTTSGANSLLGGNQVTAPIGAPSTPAATPWRSSVTRSPAARRGAAVKNTGTGPGGSSTSGRSAGLGGNQVIAPVSAPINVCGVAVAVFGDAFSGCEGGSGLDRRQPRSRPTTTVRASPARPATTPTAGSAPAAATR